MRNNVMYKNSDVFYSGKAS